MNKIVDFLKDECEGWKKWEVLWLLSANLVILGVSIFLGDSGIGVFASITGVTCVILAGKGKASNYLFGTINVILYSVVAFNAKYYGEVMLNLLYYFPTNFIGWYMWNKHMNKASSEVYKERMSKAQSLLVGIVCIAGIFGYSYILGLLGGNLPLVDSMSTVISVVAQILMIKRYMEQWFLWIIVDVVTVIMWIMAFFNGGESIAVLLMWSVYLINAIIMFVKWYRESKDNDMRIAKGTNYGTWEEV